MVEERLIDRFDHDFGFRAADRSTITPAVFLTIDISWLLFMVEIDDVA